jgi:hypothetical protein
MAFAQEGAPVSLQESAQKRSADWETLAKGLDAKISRLLPCDPRVKASIEEVSRASEVRLAALGEVMKAAVVQAKADADRTQLAIAAEDTNLREADVERTETLQERVAVDAQLADLTDSVRRRNSLENARQRLSEIDAMTAQRATAAEHAAQVRSAVTLALRDLLTALQARQRSLLNEQAALTLETSRWSEYYAARLARAQTECAITAPAAPRAKKKP